MTTIYVFYLVLGGGFLGLSLLGDLLGGHADVDAHHGGAAAKIFSIRTVIYTLFGFGAVGTLPTWMWGGASPVLTAGLAA